VWWLYLEPWDKSLSQWGPRYRGVLITRPRRTLLSEILRIVWLVPLVLLPCLDHGIVLALVNLMSVPTEGDNLRLAVESLTDFHRVVRIVLLLEHLLGHCELKPGGVLDHSL
jgi:hypothetical protein